MTEDPRDGARVGPYRLGRLLGRGGMAVVYEATHESIGRTVALKFISPDVDDEAFAERFRDEGRMQAALDHPHIVPVYEAGSSPYGPYLAMRLVRGTTLAGLIDGGGLSSARTLDLLEQVAGALDAAHDAGLVHRDVKPRNVLVEDGDHAYLADFGLTRHSDTTSRTASGHFMGTIAYAAPEVVAGDTPGPAADRYALAAVLFECLTGTPVFPRPSHAAVLYAHTHEPPPRVSGRREAIPAALDDVLITGLAKDPRDRPGRAADLVARARDALSGIELGPPAPRVLTDPDDGTTAGQVTLPGPSLPRRPRRSRRSLALAALAGAALGAVVVGLLGDGGGDSQPAPRATAPGLPPAPAGSVRIGSDLAAPGRTVDCRAQPVRQGSPLCTILQERASDDRTLVVPRNGVVRRWGVRSARGELALSVLRRSDDGFFQINRSRSEFVEDAAPHAFRTALPVERGDRLALVAIGGSGIGLRPADGATTQRFLPDLTGLGRRAGAGPAGDLLLRADYVPGRAYVPLPPQLTGPAAAAAPDGKVLTRTRARFPDGVRAEGQVVQVTGGLALDVRYDGRRVTRLTLPDVDGEVAPDVRIGHYVPPDAARRIGFDISYRRVQSQRLITHYVDVRGHRVRFFT